MQGKKQQMMRLWKETFHDSDEYISLVFDSYYEDNYALTRYAGDKLISSLLAIPYNFIANDSSSELRGLYLCGLSTVPDYRSHGIMTEMIEEINLKAYNDGFDFTFLIPDSEINRRYYSARGYCDCFRRIENRFVSNHDFLKNIDAGYSDIISSTECSVISHNNRELLNSDLVDRIYECYNDCKNLKSSNLGFIIDDSRDDLEIILREALISNAQIIIAKRGENIVSFCSCVERNEDVVIYHLFANNNMTKYITLEYVKNHYQQKSIVLYDYPENCRDVAIWSPVFSAAEGAVSGNADWEVDKPTLRSTYAKNYGMARILNPSKILKNAATVSPDSKFSILTQQEFSDKLVKYTAENGVFTSQELSRSLHPNQEILTMQNLAAIIWRSESMEDEIGIAFGLPRVPFNMSYLLD